MKIKILHETDNYLVISKPIGISVHPGALKDEYTIRDWLLENYPEAKNLPWKTKTREGIVHRLDKDTGGILLLAKNPQALDFFQEQFHDRAVEKHYAAIVLGVPSPETGEIDAFLRRDPKDRERQRVELIDFGQDEAERKHSATEYKTLAVYFFRDREINMPMALLDVRIFTGRKHQIRAHMKYIGCPVLGDQKYYNKQSKRLSKKLGLDHQLLHARSLKIANYPSGEPIELSDQLPTEFSKFEDFEK